MKKLFLLAIAMLASVTSQAYIYWTSNPWSAASGTAYTMSAYAAGDFGMTEIWIYKNGAYYAYSYGYIEASVSATSTDYGAQYVDYMAFTYIDDALYSDYIYHSVQITQPNQAPTITWVQNPSWVPVGQNFVIQARGNDADGNLTNVFVWREWVPFAFNGGGNGYEGYSDANAYSQGYAGTVTFMAQAQDSNGAQSPVIYHSVNIYVPNTAPTVNWVNYPGSAWVNQTFNVQAHAHDDGNMSWIYVWKDDQPFAFNGGGNGTDAWSDNNPAYGTNPTVPVVFKAQAGDAAGATSGFITQNVTINNRAPNNLTLGLTGATVGWNATYGHYTMWAETASTITSTLHDDDGNLYNHTVRYQKVIGAGPDDNAWTIMGNNMATNGTDSSKTFNQQALAPFNTPGRWDVNTFGHDGWISLPGMSFTVWVYGPNNGATVLSQSIPASLQAGQKATVSVSMRNTGDKPWNSDATPHSLGAENDIATWGPGRVGLPVSIVNPYPMQGSDVTFTFDITAPMTTGSTPFRFRMVEDGVTWFGGTTTGSINVVAQDNPSLTPQILDASNNVITPDPSNRAHVKLNQAVKIRLSASSPASAVAILYWRLNRPGGVQGTAPSSDWVWYGNCWGGQGNTSGNPTWTSQSFTADTVGAWDFWYHASTASALPWGTQTPWTGNNFGWITVNVPDLLVDNSAPSVPANLQATNILTNSFTLTWNVSTDDNALAPTQTYEIFQDGVSIGYSTTASFTVGGLTQSATYSMTVRAKDRAGNVSAVSSPKSVTMAADPNADNDGDGMSNGFEQTFFGGPTAGDPNADPDNDGLSNVVESNLYNAAVNPNAFRPNVYDYGRSVLGGAIPAGWPNTNDPTKGYTVGQTFIPYVVGTTAGTLQVNKSGAATYSVPIWVTPGTAGMQPQLSLNYSSQAGYGIAGYGWSLGGVSSITRGPQTKAIDGINKGVTLTTDDRFYLDGQRLIAISGTYGADNTVYRTEIDSFTRVISTTTVAANGPDKFMAWTKSGLKIEYGYTADSARDAGSTAKKLSWHVNKISDTAGNEMAFSYTENATTGEFLISQIDYTKNGTSAAYASVVFSYENRDDWFKGYQAGVPVSNLSRLFKITSKYGATVARTYELEYTFQPDNFRNLLTKITEKGKDGLSYPPLTFQYEQPVAGWDAATTYNLPASIYLGDNYANSGNGWPTGTGTGFVDINGDGRADLVYAADTNASSYYGSATGWTAAPSSHNLPAPLAVSSNAVTVSGARFVDLNGDGLVDYVYNKYGSNGTLQQNKAWINTGSSWDDQSLTWAVLAPVARDGTQNDDPLRGGKFLDIDGDGRVDFVTHMSNGSGTTNLSVYLNNGNGWNALHSGYSTMGYNLAKYKARFIDLNGDGRPDIVVNYANGGDVLKKAWLNNGNGWDASTAYELPQIIADNQSRPLGAEFMDVNSDGLPDLVWYREQGSTAQRGVAVNTGAGWIVASQTGTLAVLQAGPSQPGTEAADIYSRYAPPSPLSRDGETTAGTAMIDLNADGLPDYANRRTFSNGTSANSILYGVGHAWNYPGASAPHNLPVELLSGTIKFPGVDFVDFDGDGVADVVRSRKNSNQTPTVDSWHNKAKPTVDRLVKITNGFGISVQIEYKPLTDSTVYTKGAGSTSPVFDIAGPMYVVSLVKHDNLPSGTLDTRYVYRYLRGSIDRGNLGFGEILTVDLSKTVRTLTTFKQNYPYIGLPNTTKTWRDGTDAGVGTGGLLSESTVTYNEKLPNGSTAATMTHFPYAATVEEKNYDLTASTLLATTTTTTDYDLWGNPSPITVNTDNQFIKTTTNTYTNTIDTTTIAATKWWLGRLTDSTVVSQAPGKPNITRTARFQYSTTTGLLEWEKVQPDDPIYELKTSYGYDGFGNRTTVTISGPDVTVANDGNVTPVAGQTLSRVTTTLYDGAGRFPSSTTNALNHQETYTIYDTELGVLKAMTGANGLPSSFEYDGFGRKVHEHRADNTDTYVSYKWSLNTGQGALAPAGTLHFVETTASGLAPTLEFCDALGRVRWNLGINGDGAIVYQETQYDALGRAFKKSLPSLNSSPAYYAQTSFDLLDRPLTVTTPDEENGTQTTSYSYSGFVATVTDAKNRVIETTKNSQGRTTSNIRNKSAGASAADYSAVTYDYDALGNLSGTTAAGVSTTLGCDIRGRKTSMVDADMGTWLYRYNCFGELIWQKDAKAQIVKLEYDGLGRVNKRYEPDGASTITTTWTYDTAVKSAGVSWKGKLGSVAMTGGYAETYNYDSVGRPSKLSRTIDSVVYDFETTYDGYGRPLQTKYPATGIGSAIATRNVYNGFGYLKEIRNWLDTDTDANSLSRTIAQPAGLLYWQADSFDASGRINGETYGNGLANDRVYSAATGRLIRATIDRGAVIAAPFFVQDLNYSYDAVGNVKRRYDTATGRDEYFYTTTPSDGYDGLDRLKVHRVIGGSTVTVTYNQLGNITNKSDVGAYAYAEAGSGAGSHGVSTAGTNTYTYDLVGNMLAKKLGGTTVRSQDWTSFNQLKKVTTGSLSSEFSFGAAHDRVMQVRKNGATVTETTIYVGALYEKVTTAATNLVEHKHYIIAPTGRIAVLTTSKLNNVVQPNTTRYFHTDGLGSITTVSDERARVLKRYVYDAWGKQSATYTNTGAGITNQAPTTRGFTDHEMLADHGLVHMNGRVYDPVLGRFLSADPNVDGAGDAQGQNRYSYLGNNPLGATDPTGYFGLKDAFKIIVIVVAAVVGAITGQIYLVGLVQGMFAGIGVTISAGLAGAIAGGFAGGFASGFAGSLLNGASIGDAFKAGLIGGLSGAVTAGLLHGIGAMKLNPFERGLAHGLVQGGAAEATGGEFRHGFYSGFAVGATERAVGMWAQGSKAKGIAAAAAVGGTASALGGGKFANGAVSGAFGFLFNWASQHGFFVHQEANRKALGENTSDNELEILDRATVDADKDQSSAGSYKHAMRDGDRYQTVDDARVCANAYVRLQFKRAWELKAAGKWGEALYQFGLALHTLQDSTSSEHYGFQEWRERWGNLHSPDSIWGIFHGLMETGYPGNNSALYNITRASWTWFKSGSLPEGDLFSIYGHD